jgi:hypothetical protein
VEKRKGLRFLVNPRFYWSGRGDLNSGPPEPHSEKGGAGKVLKKRKLLIYFDS